MAELDAKRTLMLGDSAKVIQRRGRTRITRRKYVSIWEASICVQSFCRGECKKDEKAYLPLFFKGKILKIFS